MTSSTGTDFVVIPAIDLRGGKCVRLRQGDFDQETVFGDDPAATAAHWQFEGARRLHLVDLDGAKSGKPEQMDVVRAIIERVAIPCQVGGGLRDDAAVETYLECGVDRVIIGTRALRDAAWFRGLVHRHPGKVALGLDARAGKVATHGWLTTSQMLAIDLAAQFDDLPLSAVIYTEISRDGMMAGPDLVQTGALATALKTPVIASGGVAALDDVARLAALPISGCIVGRALYEGRICVREAQAVADRARDGHT